MSRPTQTQTGAFFGLLASALIFALTAMALVSVGAQSPRPHPVHMQTVDGDGYQGPGSTENSR